MFNNFFAEFEMKKVFILFLMSIIFSSLALSRTIDIKKRGDKLMAIIMCINIMMKVVGMMKLKAILVVMILATQNVNGK